MGETIEGIEEAEKDREGWGSWELRMEREEGLPLSSGQWLDTGRQR